MAVPGIPSTCWLCRTGGSSGKSGNGGYFIPNFHKDDHAQRESGGSRVFVWSIFRRLSGSARGGFNGRWRLSAVDTRIVQNSPVRATLDIPVTCFQLIGVTNQAEKDEIVKSVMVLKNAEIEEGYSMDVVVSRQDLLMDVRDKLLFEPEYAGNVKEKIPPKSSLQVPWAWLTGGLCLLQEVGEVKLVLEIGRLALQHPDSKPYVHDLLLSMALAECTTAKIGFEKNKVSEGFEALARARGLLRSKKSFEELTLLYQIEESLEELAPACTLELLGFPNSPENAERRQGAILALHELLRQGLDVEASCQVEDWMYFLTQALKKLTASEIIDLLPWADLAVTRKNKKSFESQNQRGVIDYNCFYTVLMAHIALGFSSKQRELISKAKTICESLITSESGDLKLEESFCLFLLGQGNKNDVVENLKHVELNSNALARNSMGNTKDASGGNQSLETWLKDSVLYLFPDTKDCSPALESFFNGEKRIPVIKKNVGVTQTMSAISHRSMTNSLLSERRDLNDLVSRVNPAQHLGTFAKQSSSTSDKGSSGTNVNPPSVQLKRNLGAHRGKIWESCFAQDFVVKGFSSVAFLGCVLFASFKLTSLNAKDTSASRYVPQKPSASLYSVDNNLVPAYIEGDGISEGFRKLLYAVTRGFKNNAITSRPASSLSSSSTRTVSRRLMPMEEAEELVRQWQEIKAEALGPDHQVHSLSEILDESMLGQWHTLADSAKSLSCYWKFVLLQLSVLQAEILLDATGEEMAEIQALLEEAAELVNESDQKNPSYYSTYKIRYLLRRQDDGSWRFCEGDIQSS